MSGKPKWIRFVEQQQDLKKKTRQWHIINELSGAVIGHIAWYAQWRKYAFWPWPNTIYEPTCLSDITSFLIEKTKEQFDVSKARRAY